MASTDMPSAVAAPTGAAVRDSYDVLILDAASQPSLNRPARREQEQQGAPMTAPPSPAGPGPV